MARWVPRSAGSPGMNEVTRPYLSCPLRLSRHSDKFCPPVFSSLGLQAPTAGLSCLGEADRRKTSIPRRAALHQENLAVPSNIAPPVTLLSKV